MSADGGGTLPDLVTHLLYAAVVSDILDDLGHRDHTLDPAIRPLGHGEYCRDARSITALGYPVWCRGTLPLDCKGRTAVTAWRQPAVIGGLQVRPGDLVVADDDGVVVVPAELADETIRRALAKASKEHGLRDALEAGSTLRAAYDRFGVL
jgi:regulator of RNase E activity RraA